MTHYIEEAKRLKHKADAEVLKAEPSMVQSGGQS